MKKRGKRTGKGGRGAAVAVAVRPVHPLIVQADLTPELAARGAVEVAEVASPYHAEMVDRDGRLILSKAVRRVPRYETLFKADVFDRSVFAVLAWYAAQIDAADAGLFKCGLDQAGGGGGGSASHIPTSEARMRAATNLRWARSTIPADMRDVFDAVMRDDMSFTQIGATMFAHMCASRGREKAASIFRIAANWLLLGVGPTLGTIDQGDAQAVQAAMVKMMAPAKGAGDARQAGDVLAREMV